MTAMAMGQAPRERSLRNGLELVTALTSRDLRLRYQGSVLGWAWSLARPLALGAVLAFALGRVLGTGVTAEFLLAGLFPWFWFQGAVQGSAGSFIGNGGLLKKVRFPRAVLPLSTVLGATLQFVFSLPVLVGFVLLAGNDPDVTWLALPLVFALQLALATGIGLFVASVTVFFRDLEHLVEVGLTLLFYGTPIIYSIDLVPSGYRWLTYVNPLSPIIEAWRSILLDGALPPWGHLGASAGLTALALTVGWVTFRKLEDGFADAV